MESLVTRKSLGMAVASVLFVSCAGAGNGTGMPSAQSQLQGLSSHIGSDAASLNLSGQYKGTEMDSVYGKGKAVASYAQYQSSVGGILNVKYAKRAFRIAVSFAAKGDSLNGTSVSASATAYCTYATTGSYDTKRNVVTGSYRAVAGCTGDTGTFKLKHVCTYKGNRGNDIGPATLPHNC